MAAFHSRFISRKIVLVVSVALAWVLVQAVLSYQFLHSWEFACWDAAVFTATLGIAAFAASNLLLRYLPESGKHGFAVGLSLLAAWASVWLGGQAIDPWISDPLFRQFLSDSEYVRLVIHFLWMVGITLGTSLSEEVNRKKAEVQQESDVKAFVREAELQKLQLQLQPHFLFNSLNSINALILFDTEKARDMIGQLSDFLRATLKRADEQWISLEEEFTYINLYLSIEKVRFGHRLQVEADLDEQLKLWLIPPLILQPLVENAIKFGLYGTTDQVKITMITSRVDDHLMIQISNPFDADAQSASGTGFGLHGLKRRLYLLYARNDLVQTRTEGNQFIVQLILPEKYEGDRNR
ncbi:MAG: sensor histidine kinase [Cyclobacteriaceae bacterium]|jgi:two-component system LytT family sensor kinase